MDKRCDGVADCDDKLDERHCEMVIMDEDIYKKEHPPVTKETHQTNITVDVSLFSVDDFNEIEMTYSVKFCVELKW